MKQNKKSNIVYFPVLLDCTPEQTETIRAKKVAVNRLDRRVVVIAMNHAANGSFKWGELLMMVWSPDKPLQFIGVIDRIPDGKPWRILKR